MRAMQTRPRPLVAVFSETPCKANGGQCWTLAGLSAQGLLREALIPWGPQAVNIQCIAASKSWELLEDLTTQLEAQPLAAAFAAISSHDLGGRSFEGAAASVVSIFAEMHHSIIIIIIIIINKGSDAMPAWSELGIRTELLSTSLRERQQEPLRALAPPHRPALRTRLWEAAHVEPLSLLLVRRHPVAIVVLHALPSVIALQTKRLTDPAQPLPVQRERARLDGFVAWAELEQWLWELAQQKEMNARQVVPVGTLHDLCHCQQLTSCGKTPTLRRTLAVGHCPSKCRTVLQSLLLLNW
eukprot:4313604-Amphidinium_carterae.1